MTAVRNFLITNMGYTEEKAEEVCKLYPSLLERGERMESFAYYVASELHDKVKEDLFDGKEPPEDWDGYDPDWEEPEDEDEDDDRDDGERIFDEEYTGY